MDRHICTTMWSSDQTDDMMDLTEIITPPKKHFQAPYFVDEDSGLGMDFEELASDDRECGGDAMAQSGGGCKRDMLRPSELQMSFPQKRCHDNNDGNFVAKKLKQNGRILKKKSLSFMDKPILMHDQNDVREVVDRFVDGDDVIGNGSQSYCLPTIPGKHSDLRSISADTLTDVILGRYDDVINSYRIIDCRYPYEYHGGHIKGAENRHTNEQILELLYTARQNTNKRDILIFHCEFSSERGPKRSRLLRNKDRQLNKERYPFLNFPEVYLLHNGYKAFFESHKEFCEPMNYIPMNHANYLADLRHFRSKSKTWCGTERKRPLPLRLAF